MMLVSPTVEEVVDRLVQEFQPEAIILFGSNAWGRPDSGSDLDILVIVSDSDQSAVQRAIRAQHSLRGLLTPVDVLVKTRTEVERYRNVYASLEAQIVEGGKVLYERQTGTGEKLAV